MCDFEVVQNNKYTAVFVNTLNAVPLEITPQGIYRADEYSIQELCVYTYLFEGSIKYEIFKWEHREPKSKASLSLMKTVLEQQKAFYGLLK